MTVTDKWFFWGFLSITYELTGDVLLITERSPAFLRESRILLRDLSPNFVAVKKGPPHALTFMVYVYVLVIALHLFGWISDTGFVYKSGCFLVLLFFIVEHLRPFRVTQFLFKNEKRAVQIKSKQQKFITMLAHEIRRNHEPTNSNGGAIL